MVFNFNYLVLIRNDNQGVIDIFEATGNIIVLLYCRCQFDAQNQIFVKQTRGDKNLVLSNELPLRYKVQYSMYRSKDGLKCIENWNEFLLKGKNIR